jgi:hypothetical protein
MTRYGVLFRGSLYFVIAVLTAAGSTDAIASGTPLTPKDWISIAIAGAIAIRAFIDTSNADAKNKDNSSASA